MNTLSKGTVIGINGSLVSATSGDTVVMNEIAYISLSGGKKLMTEVIKIVPERIELQVYERTVGIKAGMEIEFTGELLSAELGPGILGQVYDGLQNPLEELASQEGNFLPRGIYLDPLDYTKKWDFEPTVALGDKVRSGMPIGVVSEGSVKHKILVPCYLLGEYEVSSVAPSGSYTLKDKIGEIKEAETKATVDLTMSFRWPVKKAMKNYSERLHPDRPLVTQMRVIDSFFPVAKGGTFCVPGPFGAGKTVIQQSLSRYADVDIVVVVACGERAGEVVETLREFPELEDPRTGRSLMERTVIICNTSSMPVAARESSVYMGVTIAEYFREMGLDILLIADSTSRWAQAMREMSGLLEEIPGEEAFPAYLETRIANFYERAGAVKLYDGTTGSVTLGGTVSPAGGNFEEPVTQATLKVVGAFLGLSRARSDARKFPALDYLDSWSHYNGLLQVKELDEAFVILRRSHEVDAMMKVVGEEGVSTEDYIVYQKGEFVDAVYLQQNAFDDVDAACPDWRQRTVFSLLKSILDSKLGFTDKSEARSFFSKLRAEFLQYNQTSFENEQALKEGGKSIETLLASAEKG